MNVWYPSIDEALSAAWAPRCARCDAWEDFASSVPCPDHPDGEEP